MNKRYFIAIDFPKDICDELRRVQHAIKTQKLFVARFVEPKNLHLTLRFLGAVNDVKIHEIEKALKNIIYDPFECSLGSVGLFTLSDPRVLWVDVISEKLDILQQKIDEIVSAFIQPDPKKFVSHVTLARIKQVHDHKKLLELIEKTDIKPLSFMVDHVVLKESELTSDGPIYTDRAWYQLQNSNT